MFFDGWFPILRVVIVGALAYAGLVVVLRMTGKRTLSKMNAFDLIVTVALGSTLATILLSSRVALATGLIAFALLAGLQYVVAWASVRSTAVARMVKAEPRLLFHDGSYLQSAMNAERVTKGEILQAMRNKGVSSVDQVAAVVLETDGTLNVIERASGPETSLADVA
jgi:uncharacterized membrane protein YcaP (DUF421 family)